MLKEEFRFHTSHSKRYIFLSFPVMVCMFSFFAAVASPRLFKEIPRNQMITMVHASLFLYGLSVGAFAFLGMQIVERRFGTRNYLVTMPSLLPITFKKTFFALYIRDVIFYVALIIVPLTFGLLLSIPITGFNISSIFILFIAVLFSFLLGMSASFLMSGLYVRFPKFFTGVICGVVIAIVGSRMGFYSLGELALTLRFQFTRNPIYLFETLVLVGVLSITGTLLIKEELEAKHTSIKGSFQEYEQHYRMFKRYSILVAKEFLDLGRSRTFGKIFFSFIMPLVFLGMTSWLVKYGLDFPVGFNSVFYAAMVGFIGIIAYSWLNNVDLVDYYETLPITVPQVIKAKLLVFFILIIGISSVFVLGITIINNELNFLWLALIVMIITSIYMAITIAYLTGLRTNTTLFAPDIMIQFWILAFLPDMCIAILSFSMAANVVFSLLGLAIVCTVLMLASLILYRGIDRKWAKAEFMV